MDRRAVRVGVKEGREEGRKERTREGRRAERNFGNLTGACNITGARVVRKANQKNKHENPPMSTTATLFTDWDNSELDAKLTGPAERGYHQSTGTLKHRIRNGCTLRRTRVNVLKRGIKLARSASTNYQVWRCKRVGVS